MPEINAGDTAFIMIATAMVLLMTVPGLAMFYGGMVRAKSTLNMIMMSFGAMVVIALVWVTFGYSITFGPAIGSGSWSLLGNPATYWGLGSIMNTESVAQWCIHPNSSPNLCSISRSFCGNNSCLDFRGNCRSRTLWPLVVVCRNLGNGGLPSRFESCFLFWK